MEQLPVIDISALRRTASTARASSTRASSTRTSTPRTSTTDAVAGGPSAAERAVAEQLDAACRRTGFFLVTGHGVEPQLLAELDRAARSFFARPESEKETIAMRRGGRAWRGWFPEGGELTAGRPDHKEGLYFGAELPADDPRVVARTPLHGPNLFPTNPSELRPLVLAWMEQLTRVGHDLVRGLAIGLDLDPAWFDRHLTAEPTTLFRIFRYPPRPPDDDGWGVAEHTDYGLLTVLAHDGTPGLQVRTPTGWIDVPTVPEAFVVNLGDMLERMTAGRYRSTPHRVRTTDHDDRRTSRDNIHRRDRLSFPFFFDPGWDAQILPVPGLAAGELTTPAVADPPRWDGADVHGWSGTYGDYLTAKVAKVFPVLGDTVLGDTVLGDTVLGDTVLGDTVLGRPSPAPPR